MSTRYKTRRRISIEIGGIQNGLKTSSYSPPGFSVYDTQEKVDLPEFYKTENEATAAAEKLNSELS